MAYCFFFLISLVVILNSNRDVAADLTASTQSDSVNVETICTCLYSDPLYGAQSINCKDGFALSIQSAYLFDAGSSPNQLENETLCAVDSSTTQLRSITDEMSKECFRQNGDSNCSVSFHLMFRAIKMKTISCLSAAVYFTCNMVIG